MKNIFKIGQIGSPIVVVTDWSSAAMLQRGQHMPDNHTSYLLRKLQEAGISQSEIILINPCPIYPGWESKKPPTAKQHKEHVQQYHKEFMEKLAPVVAEAKVVLVLGKSAAMQVFNSAVAVTKARGQFKEMEGIPLPIMVTLSPAHVMSRPEVARDFETDLKSIATLRKNKWKKGDGGMKEGDYKLVTDLSEWLKDRPPALAVDTETTGLQWANDATLLTIQLTAQEGQSFVLPISGQMFPDIPRDERLHVLGQFRTLMADPRIKVFGHNFKFDCHMMARYRVRVANWWMDTLQLAFAADENMQSKSLKECVRRWVPSMSGYSDVFDSSTDKSNLIEADPAEVVKYGGGDTDATFRLCRALCEEVGKDRKQWDNVTKIQMPALRMFYDMERRGMMVNQTRLRELGVTLHRKAYELESSLLKMVPKKVKQKHFAKGLSFGRREFLQDILFTDDGLKLKPITRLADETPATDAIHLSNFAHVPFVQAYTEFTKVKKMLSTYVGTEKGGQAKPVSLLKNGGWPVAVRRMTNHEPEELHGCAKLDSVHIYDQDGDLLTLDRMTEWGNDGKCLGRDKDNGFHILSQIPATGFWKHIMPDGKVHASFFLDKTVTGRASARDPSFMNIPKRGSLAKPYRRIFVPSKKGNVMIECDMSQAELRFAACESLDPVMLKTYRDGGDIHALTASKVAGIAMSMVTPELRQKAKAVNFGYLYCISEGQRVLTRDRGLVPIENVLAFDLVWDGLEWVSHEGVIFKGYKEVISWDGLTATENHEVWIEDGRKIPFGDAASKGYRLATTGIGTETRIWHADPARREHTEGALHSSGSGVRGLHDRANGIGVESYFREDNDLQVPASSEISRPKAYREAAGNPLRQYGSALPTGYACILTQLQRAWDQCIVFLKGALHSLGIGNVSGLRVCGERLRPDGQQRPLLAREPAGGVSEREPAKQKKVKVYDILNAGTRHRFTCEGKLVSNCMGPDSFMVYAKASYGVSFTKDEARSIQETYFSTYKNLRKWHEKRKQECRRDWQVRGLLGALRRLPAIHSADRGVQAESERQAINSPIQRVASDVTLMAMSQFSHGCPDWLLPLGTIHDSGIIECPGSESDTVASWVKWCFINPPVKELFGVTFPIPLGADVAVGPDLGSMVELKDVEAVKPPWIR